MEIGFISWFFFFLTCYWIGAFSILFILIKSQHCSWKADASCRTHCQVHIPGFLQVILVDVWKPLHRWVLCPRLILPPDFNTKGERGVRGDAFPYLHWMPWVLVWRGKPRTVAKLQLCDLSNIVWVSWSKPGYLFIYLFTGTTTVPGARARCAVRTYLDTGRRGMTEAD